MKRTHALSLLLLAAIAAGGVSEARADKTKAARELAEFLMRKLGGKAIREGSEALAKRIATAAARHGDDVFAAVRKVGPKALSIADDAAEHAPRALRFLARHGDEAAAVLARPRSMKLFASLGDDAAAVMLKHKGIAEPLLEGYGNMAVRALKVVNARNGRRLAMLAQTGTNIRRILRAKKVVDAIAKYGDKAVNFIWEHRVQLAVGATFAAFIANPDPFIDGTLRLTETVAKEVVVPVTSTVINGGARVAESVMEHAVRPVVAEAARSIPWGAVTVAALVIFGAFPVVWLGRRLVARPAPALPNAQAAPAG